jgi:hypothetical protein
MPKATIERRVYFFRVDSDPDPKTGGPAPFDAKGIFTALKGEPFTDAGLYLDGGNGHTNVIFVDRLSPNVCVRYATVRHEDLPTIELGGRVSPLRIQRDEGICEPIHVVFFDNNIVGAEFNFYGPRLTGLAWYLKEKAPPNLMPKHLRFGMLLKKDPVGFLDQVQSLKLMDLKISAAYLQELKALGDNPFGGLEAAAEFGKADTVEIVLQAGRKKDSALSEKIRGFITKVIGKNKLSLTQSFVIRGTDKDTGRSVTFDLLAESLISNKTMVVLDERSRAIKSESAYTQIRAAYKELKDELEAAPSA